MEIRPEGSHGDFRAASGNQGLARKAGQARGAAVSASLFAALILLPRNMAGADIPDLEREVKAAFLYQFTRFAAWPERSFRATGNSLVVGVLGEDPFRDALDRTLAGKVVSGRPLAVRRFRSLEEVGACHLLFVNLPGGKERRAALARLGLEPILTVGEDEAFLDEGGVLRLRTEDRRVRFEVNLEAARRAGIELSSRLLQVASRVRDARDARR